MRLRTMIRVLPSLLGLVGCESGARGRSRGASEQATAIVRRYVAAETSGVAFDDSAMSLFLPCEGDRAVDFIEPTEDVSIRIASPPMGDTVFVEVRYATLGRGDWRSRRGSDIEEWHFDPEVQVEIDTLPVVFTADQRPLIVCGPFHGNHWSVSTVVKKVSSIDDESRSRWRATLRQLEKK